jgi:hypothetical protein
MKQRFPIRLQCWMSEQLAATTEMVALHQETTPSTIIRQALTTYFLQIGALTPQPAQPVNGQHREQARGVHV